MKTGVKAAIISGIISGMFGWLTGVTTTYMQYKLPYVNISKQFEDEITKNADLEKTNTRIANEILNLNNENTKLIEENNNLKIDLEKMQYTSTGNKNSSIVEKQEKDLITSVWLDSLPLGSDYDTTYSNSGVTPVGEFKLKDVKYSRGIKVIITNPDGFYKPSENETERIQFSYNINKKYANFEATIVVDDTYFERALKPSHIQIYGDDVILYESPFITSETLALPISFDIANVNNLMFVIDTVTVETGLLNRDLERDIFLAEAKISN